MKTQGIKVLPFIVLSLAAIVISSFSGKVQPGIQEVDLLRNEQQREQAFNQILNEEKLFSEFMNRMADHPEGMKMMRENRMQIMQERPEMREEMREDMLQMMQEHPPMRGMMMENMMQMMEEHPPMREMMMENMMQMMEEDHEMREEMMEKMREHDHMHHEKDHH